MGVPRMCNIVLRSVTRIGVISDRTSEKTHCKQVPDAGKQNSDALKKHTTAAVIYITETDV